MANMIKQRRASFSELLQRDNQASSKDKKSPNPYHQRNSQNYDSIETEHVAAIAAATFAIHSLEEKTSSQLQIKEKTREEVEASTRARMSPAHKAPSFSKPIRSSSIHGSRNTKVDAWEQAELLKIQNRYKKNNLTIVEWENEKKARAKRRVEEKKKELEQRRSINWQHYQNKLARIDHVAGGARSQAEEKRSNDEKRVKGRAREMRSLGVSSPKYCFFC
ncbi:hypothetical protein LXL04_008676 [Taraxacum kok-saghyz]